MPAPLQIFIAYSRKDASFLDEQRTHFTADPASATKLLKAGERSADATLSPTELAATAVLVSTLMNHDEFVMKR